MMTTTRTTRRRTGVALVLTLLAALTGVANASGTIQSVDAVTLNAGENFLRSAVTDGTHAYFGTNSSPGRVVKVNLATMTRVSAVTLNAGEDNLRSAVTDGTHAYFGTHTSPGRVVRIDLGNVTASPQPTTPPSTTPVGPSYTG